MKNVSKNLEQEQLFFDSLSGKEKRDYFVVYFISEFVFALKDKRRNDKITQSEIAKKMGVKQSYISKVENLEKIPTIETIAKYIFALNYSLEEVEFVKSFSLNECDVLPTLKLFSENVKSKSATNDLPYVNRNNCGQYLKAA